MTCTAPSKQVGGAPCPTPRSVPHLLDWASPRPSCAPAPWWSQGLGRPQCTGTSSSGALRSCWLVLWGWAQSCWTLTFLGGSWASELDAAAWPPEGLPCVLCTLLWLVGGGAPCGELGLEYRNHGSLCLPAPSPQALCLGFSTCGCGLFVLVSWAWVYSGATGCSWGRDWITVTQSPGWEATPSSGVTCSALDTAGGCSGPGWAPRSQEHNMTHWAGLKGQGARRPLGGTPRWG